MTAWLVAVIVPPCCLYAWRDRRLAELSTPEARRQWETFREDVRRQADRAGPVQRKVPKSVEPPELVWLRDYALLAITAWVTLAGVLGGVLATLVVGVTGQAPPGSANTESDPRGSTAQKSTAQEQPAGDRDHEEQHDGDGKHADERRHG